MSILEKCAALRLCYLFPPERHEVVQEAKFTGFRPAREPVSEVKVDGLGVVTMSISLEPVATKYLTAKKLSGGTRKAYKLTVSKWVAWGDGVDDAIL